MQRADLNSWHFQLSEHKKQAGLVLFPHVQWLTRLNPSFLGRLGSTDQSHPLQLPLWAWTWLPEIMVPFERTCREAGILGPSPSQKDGGRGRIAYQSLFCNAVGSLSSTVRAAKFCFFENSLIFQNSVASSPQNRRSSGQNSLTACPAQPCPTGNLLLLWISSASDCKVQTLALVKTCLALMPEQYLVRETVSSYIHISR